MALISHIRICDTIAYTCIKSEFVSCTHFIHLYIASHNTNSGNALDQWTSTSRFEDTVYEDTVKSSVLSFLSWIIRNDHLCSEHSILSLEVLSFFVNLAIM